MNILRTEAKEKNPAWAKKHLWKRTSLRSSLFDVSSFVSLPGGVPAQIFLLPHRLGKKGSVDSFSVYFIVIYLLKAPLFLELHLLSSASLKIWATLFPFVPLNLLSAIV